ncbi:PREDICTED: uncharacterized protein LOC108354477 [Rhagoletis zephyria]|uniref:uncharacterized protein LOC108354477 n=1 Tax=Rhagoletis zephyria TaxID=28612 RepID=UPI0008112393|nr:PREDICTED: uncharacterized protein LOC108354477 [Rhagoletis zephyria]
MPPKEAKQCKTKNQLQEHLVAEVNTQRYEANEAHMKVVQQLLGWALLNGLGSCTEGMGMLQPMNNQSSQCGGNVQGASLSKKARKRLRRRQRAEAQSAAAVRAGATTPKVNTTESIAPKTKEQPPNVPVQAGMLHDLAVQFRSEICVLKMLFDSELQENPESTLKNKPIVAEININNKSLLSKGAIKSIRTTILRTIENYQVSKKTTPLFYSMTNNNTYINILCEDEYAFECLKDSVVQMKSLGRVCLSTLEPNAGRLYCMSVIYTGLIDDPMKFLLHVRLQHPKIRTDYWIIASSKVCTGTHETQFLFLVDELSALALEYQYRYRLFICLEEALFHNHGQLPNLV